MQNKHVFGYPDQWEDFETRNALFIERFSALKRALDAAFIREFTTTNPAERAVHFLGRLCIEDFMELLCLAANGYGFGAIKLLRGLYERAVVASYLAKYPDEAEQFLDFRFVSRHKTLQAYIAAGEPSKAWIDQAEVARQDFERVRARFEIDNCKKCGTKRMNPTWSMLDFVAMAKKTDLGKFLAQAYYEPLNHAHSTSEAIMTRLKRLSSDQIVFESGPQPKDADRALMVAHALMVELIEVQAKFFQIPELEYLVTVCANDHIAIWSQKKIAIDPNE